jgi:hypothetical protein
MAGIRGFEPLNDGIKTRCLTAWLYPSRIISYIADFLLNIELTMMIKSGRDKRI